MPGIDLAPSVDILHRELELVEKKVEYSAPVPREQARSDLVAIYRARHTVYQVAARVGEPELRKSFRQERLHYRRLLRMAEEGNWQMVEENVAQEADDFFAAVNPADPDSLQQVRARQFLLQSLIS